MIIFFMLWTLASALDCQISDQLKSEIHGYQPLVDEIIGAVINGQRSGELYEDLADFVDTYGYRQVGTTNLEDSIDNIIERQTKAGLRVSTQEVVVPTWIRGEESAEVVSPRKQKLAILGLGNSSNTTAEGITASVILAASFEELAAKKDQVAGKIVLFNPPFVSYGQIWPFRNYGPSNASALGAVATLVRSATPFSIHTPHTGTTHFPDPTLTIPAAALAVEDVHYIERLISRGYDVKINLKMSARSGPDTVSRNVIGDIVGSSKPQEYVTISGHIDSWDVGQGAVDDADGAFLAWHSLALINELGIPPPARTLRSVMWTGEELGDFGSQAYRAEREEELRNWTVALESDGGVFTAQGITFAGSAEATCIMQEILSLLAAVNATTINPQEAAGSDIGEFVDLNIPMGEPYMPGNNYFWYHHSDGDWMDVLNSEDLDQNLAIYASTIYILANLSIPLPRATPSPLIEAPQVNWKEN